MKILWVTTLFPCLRTGSQASQFYLLKYISKTHCVNVLSLIKAVETQEIDDLRSLGIEVITLPEPAFEKPGKWINRFRSWSQVIFDPLPQFARTYPLTELEKKFQEFCY